MPSLLLPGPVPRRQALYWVPLTDSGLRPPSPTPTPTSGPAFHDPASPGSHFPRTPALYEAALLSWAPPLGAPPSQPPPVSTGTWAALTRSLDGSCGSRVTQLQGMNEDLCCLLPSDEGQLERARPEHQCRPPVGTPHPAPPAQGWGCHGVGTGPVGPQAQAGPGGLPGSLREKEAWGGQATYLRLVDLQQHRPCGKAAIIQQHVGQDGQLGGGALQGPGVGFQGLLGAGSPSQGDRGWGGRENRNMRGRDTEKHIHTRREERHRGSEPGWGTGRGKRGTKKSGEDPQPSLHPSP